MSGLSLFLGIPCSLIVNSPIQLLQAREAPTYSAGLSGVSQTGSRRRFHERGIGCEKMPSINSAPSTARARPRSCTPGGCWHGVRLRPSSKMLSSREKGSRVPAASSCADVLLGVCKDGMLGGDVGRKRGQAGNGGWFQPHPPSLWGRAEASAKATSETLQRSDSPLCVLLPLCTTPSPR